MRKNFLILLILSIASLLVFRESFKTFFAQDDFILINEFSQNSFIGDVKNTLGPPRITHWRPIDNLYYFIAGNLFSKNLFFYHAFGFLIHVLAAFFIYKCVMFFSDFRTAFFSSLIYSIHPSQFVSLFWISGNAMTIGMLFFMVSFYLFLKGRKLFSLVSYTLSLLASEAMLVGIPIYIVFGVIYRHFDRRFLIKMSLISVLLGIFKFVFLSSANLFSAYEVGIMIETLSATKYYFLRILGLADSSFNLFTSLPTFLWTLILVIVLFLKWHNINLKLICLFISIIVLGVLPFLVIPKHLSAHYAIISIWGFSSLAGFVLSKLSNTKVAVLIFLFAVNSAINVSLTSQNSWVIKRANIAKQYITTIEDADLPKGSTVEFNDNIISSSYEAYISLGTGKALDFWFKDMNYKTCFTAFEKCDALP